MEWGGEGKKKKLEASGLLEGERRSHKGRSSRGHRVVMKMSLWFPGHHSITESKEASIWL